MNYFIRMLVLLLVARVAADEFTYSGQPRIEVPATAWSRPDQTQPIGDRIRLAAYNIENFTDGINDGPDRTPEAMRHQAKQAAKLLNEIGPDIILVMEVENAASLSALNDFLDKPMSEARITVLGDGSNSDVKMNLGIMSRYPVLRSQETDFAPLLGPGKPARGFLRAEIDLGASHRLVLYAVHLKSNFGHRPRNIAQRKAAMEIIVADARSLADSDSGILWEMLIAGDTNVDPELPEFAGDVSLKPLGGWKDLWRGRPIRERTTVPTRYGDPALEFPPACFDRLFVSEQLLKSPWRVGSPSVLQKGVNTQRIAEKVNESDYVSDHYPVYIDLIR